jgi:hypothetical protein
VLARCGLLAPVHMINLTEDARDHALRLGAYGRGEVRAPVHAVASFQPRSRGIDRRHPLYPGSPAGPQIPNGCYRVPGGLIAWIILDFLVSAEGLEPSTP